MGLTDLTVRLMLIFFPGIICFLTVDALTPHQERKTHEFLLFSYIYGMLTYFIYGVIFVFLKLVFSLGTRGISLQPWDLSVFRWFSDSHEKLNFWEIISATALALVLAFLASFCDKKKLLHAIAHKLRVTKKFAEEDVWNFAFNLDDARWCVVRDMSNNLMFQGYIRAFSDVGESVELLLTQVSVYDEKTSELCYQADRIYLARKKDDLTIQFQDYPQGEEASNGGRTDKASSTGNSDSPIAGRDGNQGEPEPTEHQCLPPAQAGGELPPEQQR